ncbi:MAG: ATP-dependent Clp protease ATP-binding subunit, partial [Oscillospiraceae bacterium]|nr:ATP-dependent Clp protease ATP-binding subunit [Oscillospiraceae bacterium]
DVLDLLLQILDCGMLTDAQGRKVDFRNTVVVMTGNVGARAVLDGRQPGFERAGENEESRREAAVMEELRRSFRPEFLSRIDETVVFRRLDEEAAARITQKLLDETAARAAALGLTLCVEEPAKIWLVRRGFDARSGARSLRRLIEREIETALAEQYLTGALCAGTEVVVTAGEEGLFVAARPLSHSM